MFKAMTVCGAAVLGGALFAAEIPSGEKEFRRDFKKLAAEAVQRGDMKTFGAMVERLATFKLDGPTFGLWTLAANQLNEAALTARKRKPEEQAELTAGFREGGTTFGLNTGALEKESTVDLGASFIAASEGLLFRRLPADQLTLALTLARDQQLLAMRKKTGRLPAQLAAAETLEKNAFAAVPHDRTETNAVCSALGALGAFRLERREWKDFAALWDRIAAEKGAFYADVRAERLAALANATFQADDEAGFESAVKGLEALPLTPDLVKAVSGAAALMARRPFAGMSARRRLWRRIVDARARLDAETRVTVLCAMADFVDPARVSRLPKPPIAEFRAIWQEAVALERETEAEVAAKKRRRPVNATARLRAPYLKALEINHLWAEAYEIAGGDAFAPRANAGQRLAAVRYAALGAPADAFQRAYAAVVTNAQLKAQDRFDLKVLDAKLQARDPEDFARRVAALRADEDVPAWFGLLRGASKFLYGCDSTVEGSRYIAELVSMSADQMWPEERVEYVAAYLEDAPATAAAAWATDVFSKLKTDNRMAKFNCWDSMNEAKDLARLKSGPKPDLEAKEPGKEACVAACYDARGVHFYLKMNDPEAWKTQSGLANGMRMECSVQTGDEASWHWALFSAERPENNFEIEWDSPQPGRKMTRDFLKTDVHAAKDCYVAHVYLPWLVAYDRLPTGKDGLWRFVAVVHWAGLMGAIGGSSVHELGRGMQVRFAMDEKAALAVRLGTLRAAAGAYRRFRRQWENADFWGDPSMGDPAFYEARVKPYLAELDALAAETEGDLDAAACARLSTRLVDLADTRLQIDALRAAWLRNRLFTSVED